MNHYRGNRLSAIEEAIIQQDIDRLNAGTFTSQTEITAAIGNKGYHTVGPLGELYRAALDAKSARTQNAGFSVAGPHRNNDIYPSHATMAGATRDADGKLVVGILDVDNPHGEQRSTADNDRSGNNARPIIEHKAGGVVAASVNRDSIPFIKRSAAEQKAHEQYLEKARAKQQMPTHLPPIGEPKKK